MFVIDKMTQLHYRNLYYEVQGEIFESDEITLHYLTTGTCESSVNKDTSYRSQEHG